MSIYEPHSRNRNRLNPSQQRFIEEQQKRQQRDREVDRQVKRTQRRVRTARRIFTLLAVGFLAVLCGAPVLISGQLLSSEPVTKPTQAAMVMNTPRPTATLQSATWDTNQTTSHDDSLGYVMVPDGFWQIPGMAEAYRQGTPVAELLLQYERYQAPQTVEQAPVAPPQAQALVTPDPRIAQAQSDLEIAQIQAQIDAAQAEAAAAQQIAAAKAEQAIARNQVLAERTTWALEMIGLICLIGVVAIFVKLVGLPLLGWFFDGLVDWLGNRAVKFKYWLAEFMAPVEYEDEEPEAELPEHLQNLQVNHHGSARRQELAQQRQQLADITDAEILTVLAIWDQSQNMSECQRQAFGVTNTGGGAFRKVERILQTYRPGYNTPTPPPTLTPYLGDTTQ